MTKLFRQNINQTGIAIFEMENGSTEYIPLYSLHPSIEAIKIMEYKKGIKELSHVFYSNNLMDYKVEDKIEDFKKEYGFLPEEYMEDLVSGFPYIRGFETENSMKFYK